MIPRVRRLCWVDGELLPPSAPVVRADDSRLQRGPRLLHQRADRAGRPRFEERHLRRLARGAAALRARTRRAPRRARARSPSSANAAFAGGDGVVRLQPRRDGAGRLRLIGVRAGSAPTRSVWSAIRAPPSTRARAPAAATS